jgi:hypothetical protein
MILISTGVVLWMLFWLQAVLVPVALASIRRAVGLQKSYNSMREA